MTRTNGPCTHTSDDSYMYQLSLVVAIASISFKFKLLPKMIEHQIKCSYRYITHKMLFVNHYGSLVITISHRERNKNGPVN